MRQAEFQEPIAFVDILESMLVELILSLAIFAMLTGLLLCSVLYLRLR